ncbi:MAG: hypothetical protein ABIJ16_02310 [Bacteroidota bacterium]
MQTCTRCILNDSYPGISFNEEGVCSICSSRKLFVPFGEEKLRAIFEATKLKGRKFDALVPLSGGKDSTYILFLAVKKFGLRVMTMTYDNGLLSDMARDNINKAVGIAGVEHVFYKADISLQQKVYEVMLKYSGDFCGACDIATNASVLKASSDYRTPLILYGTSPLEDDSFLPDSIQDVRRFKHIMKLSGLFSNKEIRDYLILPRMNHVYQYTRTKTGKFGKVVCPLYYLPNPSDQEMGDIIKKEMGWTEPESIAYTKHFDCIAEPLTNHIRQKIYGYERHLCQYSNMIRRKEISREKALGYYEADNISAFPENMKDVMQYLHIDTTELEKIFNIKPLLFEKYTSRWNRLFEKLKRLKDSK